MQKMFQGKYFLKMTQVRSLIPFNMCSLSGHEGETLQLEGLLLAAASDLTGLVLNDVTVYCDLYCKGTKCVKS